VNAWSKVLLAIRKASFLFVII